MALVILCTYAILTPTLFRLSDGHHSRYETDTALPFDSDEAIHAMDGARIAADVYRRNIPLLLEHLYFTHWYPPGLPLYLAPFFVAFGPTYWSARYAILLLAIIYLALVYRVAKTLSGYDRGGGIAMLLAATSPTIWVHSLLCMEEMLALIGMLLTILLYNQRYKSRPIWLGLCMAITLLTKLSVGISTATAVLVALLFSSNDIKANFQLAYKIFIPFLAICVLWWGHPIKVRDFIHYLEASAPAYDTIGGKELIHYWKALVTIYTVSPWVGVVVLISIVSALYWADANWRLPLAIVLITWFMLLLKRQLNPRFFINAVTAAFLLTANTISKYGFRVLHRLKARRSLVSILVIVVIIGLLPYLWARIETFPFLMRVRYETDVKIAEICDWIASFISYNHPIFLVNGWDQLSTPLLNFYFLSRQWPQGLNLPNWQTHRVIGVLLKNPQTNPDAVTEFQQAVNADSVRHLIHLGNTPVPNAGAWWAYQSVIKLPWDGEWQAVSTFWVRVWDERLSTDVVARPLYYAFPQNRLSAQEKYGYPLPIEVKIATIETPHQVSE